MIIYMEKVKLVFAEYLSLVFVGLAILLFFFGPNENSFILGMGTWNLNQPIEGRGLLDNSILTYQMLCWMLMHISIVTYAIVRFKKKKTAFLGGVLHTILVLTYLFIPQFWFAFGWLYFITHLAFLCLNVAYAFFRQDKIQRGMEHILDA